VQPTYIKGTVDVSSKRSFNITGYANTSKGKVTTTVEQRVNFFNNQYFSIDTASADSTPYTQNISLGSTIASTTITSGGGAPKTVESQTFNFPLTLDLYEFDAESTGDISITTTAKQNYTATVSTKSDGVITYTSNMVNTGQHQDTIDYVTFLNSNQSSAQQYNYWDSTGAGHLCDLTAVANVLTYYSEGCKH
jgi:hypothetical protein